MQTNRSAPAQRQSLEHFPINTFASVMGFAGLSLGWQHIASTHVIGANETACALRLFTSALFLILLVVYFIKAIRYPKSVSQELQHPVKISFFATIPISIILLSQLWLEPRPELARLLWFAGAITMLVATMATFYSWMHQHHYKRPHLNPAWFIPVVGNILIPIAGVPLGYPETSWFFFSIGLVFWMVLLVLITSRLFFEPPLPDRLLPTLFILLAPPAVGFIALTSLENQQISTLSQILFGISLFFGLILISSLHRFIRLPFFLSAWAYAFPTAALTLACFRMVSIQHNSGLAVLAIGLLAILSLLVLWLLIKSILMIARGRLFVPEPPM